MVRSKNYDILVHHDINSYLDNTKEAVICVAMLKNGKMIHFETGATLLD